MTSTERGMVWLAQSLWEAKDLKQGQQLTHLAMEIGSLLGEKENAQALFNDAVDSYSEVKVELDKAKETAQDMLAVIHGKPEKFEIMEETNG